MKTAIITGIGGQDGAYLAQHLLQQGYRVVGTTRSVATFEDYRLRYLGIHLSVEIIRLREVNISAMADLLFTYQPDEVYNLTAQSSVAASFKDPFDTIEYNVLTVLAWVKAISDYAPHTRFYQASSSEMFGNISPEVLPLKENVIFHPASPYGISKATAHWIAVNYRESHQLYCACGILFNHESPLRGFAYVIKKILSHLVTIHRTGIDRPLLVGNTSIKKRLGLCTRVCQSHASRIATGRLR
ncbi:MAG: GDP-mannose 4,6-dehydratase [Saprospiraceae bacterium]|nr:GDP-mannose 4,6-dehydratase [Saprospiraceae bacterium]